VSGDRARELVARGIEAAQLGRRDEARRLLERALASEPAVADMVRAWRCLSEVADSAGEKRMFVEKVLAADPSNGDARRELAILNGTLSRGELIDPDHYLTPPAPAARQDDGGGLTCRRCGSGRMAAEPETGDLRCGHCGHREVIAADAQNPNRDVTAALWSARGRRTPHTGTVFSCGGCGAAFLMAPDRLSSTCPFCRTAYVAGAADYELIEPDGIVPFAVTSVEAERALTHTGVAGPLPGLQRLYVPAWLLSFSGQVDWTGSRRERSAFRSNRLEEVSDTYTVVEAMACVPAGRRFPEAFHTSMLAAYDWASMVPYDARLLADWPAETYQVSLETAAAAGRRAVTPSIRSEVQDGIDDDIEDLRVSLTRIGADSFQLVLVPLWIAGAEREDGESTDLFVNGQSGAAYLPERTGVMDWLSGLFRPPR